LTDEKIAINNDMELLIATQGKNLSNIAFILPPSIDKGPP
jgi:hypothetical protein